MSTSSDPGPQSNVAERVRGPSGDHQQSDAEQSQIPDLRKDPSRADSLILPAATISLEDDYESSTYKKHRVNTRRKSFGRPSPLLRAQRSYQDDDTTGLSRPSQHHHHLARLVGHVQEWIDTEKAKRLARSNHGHSKVDLDLALDKLQQILHRGGTLADDVAKQLSFDGSDPNFVYRSRKRSSISLQKLGRGASYGSDSEIDSERHPPTTDVILDNSKTLSYSSPSTTDLTRSATNSSAEAWAIFKSEIVRLSHTLKLKGWRRVPSERSQDIEVRRLSGALTNAVYVVLPPGNLGSSATGDGDNHVPRQRPPNLLLRIYGPNVEHLIDRESELAILRRLAKKHIGPKLLGTFTNGRFEEYLNAQPLTPTDLRNSTISQQIAKRMRELHQGIDLLPKERDAGPFIWLNWDKWKDRCEEVIEWLDEQIKLSLPATAPNQKWRQRGFVCGVEWKVFRQAVRNYRTWLDNLYGGPEALKDYLVFAHNDTQYGNLLRLMPDDQESPLLQPANQHRRLVVIDFEYANANTPGLEFANHFTEWCYNYHSGKPWACTTEAYPTPEEQSRFFRAYLNHIPHFVSPHPGQTPVLSAESPSLAAQSPHLGPARSGSVSTFMLDSRAPPALSSSTTSLSSLSSRIYEEEEKAREEAQEKEVKKLLRETRVWRVANSAQWVAWGIVQAKVNGMEKELESRRVRKADRRHGNKAQPANALEPRGSEQALPGGLSRQETDEPPQQHKQLIHDTATEKHVEGSDSTAAEGDGEEEEFDYLAYAQDRALFFWGDVLGLGLVKEEELPAELVARVKRVPF